MDVVVEPLSSYPEAVPTVAEWHFREWGTQIRAVRSRHGRRGWPGRPAPIRCQGIGGVLVRRCEAWAASLGYGALYLYTERGSGAQALYERLGWRIIHAGRFDGIAVTVMRASLRPVPDVPAGEQD